MKAIEAGRALVQIEAFPDDEPEWFEWSAMRPHPPGTPGGDNWAAHVKKGDRLDLYHEDAWWEMEVTMIERERLSRTIHFTLYSVVHGDEHVVDSSAVRPSWTWLSASKQWHSAHSNRLYSACAAAPMSALTVTSGGTITAKASITIAAGITASRGTPLKFRLVGHASVGVPNTQPQKEYTIYAPHDVSEGDVLPITLQLEMPRAEDQLYVTMPPSSGLNLDGVTFSALLSDGRELVVTPPEGLEPGAQMLVTIPTPDPTAARGRSPGAQAAQGEEGAGGGREGRRRRARGGGGGGQGARGGVRDLVQADRAAHHRAVRRVRQRPADGLARGGGALG